MQHLTATCWCCCCRYLPREEHAFGALVMLMFEQGLRQLYSRSMLQLQVGRRAAGMATWALLLPRMLAWPISAVVP